MGIRNERIAKIAANSDIWRSVKHQRWRLDLTNPRVEAEMASYGGSLKRIREANGSSCCNGPI